MNNLEIKRDQCIWKQSSLYICICNKNWWGKGAINLKEVRFSIWEGNGEEEM